MTALYQGTVTVATNTYGALFPDAPAPLRSIAVTALPTNKGDVYIGGGSPVDVTGLIDPNTGHLRPGLPAPPGDRLTPGASINLSLSDPTFLCLNALQGDGVNYTGY